MSNRFFSIFLLFLFLASLFSVSKVTSEDDPIAAASHLTASENVSGSSFSFKILRPMQDWIIAGNVTVEFSIENTRGYVEFAQGNSSNRIDLEVEWPSSDGTTGVGLVLWSTTSNGLTLNTGDKFTEEVYFDPSKFENISVPSGFVGDLPPYRETVIRLVHWNNFSYGEFGVTEIDVTLQETTHEGDLVIGGTQTFLIENCTFGQKGNVYARDSSKLVIANGVFRFFQRFIFEFTFFVEDSAILDMLNASAKSDFGFCIGNFDNCTTLVENSLINQITCYGGSRVTVRNSTVGDMGIADSSMTIIENASISCVGLTVHPDSIVVLKDLQPGLYEHWNLHENQEVWNVPYDLTLMNVLVWSWGTEIDSRATVRITNSTLSPITIALRETVGQIQDFRPGFYQEWIYGNISLANCFIEFLTLLARNSVCNVADSAIVFFAREWTNITLVETEVWASYYQGCTGTLSCISTEFESLSFVGSTPFIKGRLSFNESSHIALWLSSNVTREYDVIMDKNDASVEDVELTLLDENNVVWNGITDSIGAASLNLTFSDINYTDTLKLNAYKDGYYNVTTNVGFLSNTPIIINMTQKPLGDVNEDGVVNILDISLVARSFGSVQGDGRWNETCDLNSDHEINIVDISLVAKDFGKTA